MRKQEAGACSFPILAHDKFMPPLPDLATSRTEKALKGQQWAMWAILNHKDLLGDEARRAPSGRARISRNFLPDSRLGTWVRAHNSPPGSQTHGHWAHQSFSCWHPKQPMSQRSMWPVLPQWVGIPGPSFGNQGCFLPGSCSRRGLFSEKGGHRLSWRGNDFPSSAGTRSNWAGYRWSETRRPLQEATGGNGEGWSQGASPATTRLLSLFCLHKCQTIISDGIPSPSLRGIPGKPLVSQIPPSCLCFHADELSGVRDGQGHQVRTGFPSQRNLHADSVGTSFQRGFQKARWPEFAPESSNNSPGTVPLLPQGQSMSRAVKMSLLFF